MRIRKAFLLVAALAYAALAAERNHWVVTWAASPAPQLANEEQMRAAKLEFENQTLREIVHTSIGSNTVRVRLSNAYGKQTVQIGSAHVGLRAKGAEIAAGSDRALTFSGRTAVSIPPDAVVLSDPVNLDGPASRDFGVGLCVPMC